MVAAMNPRTHPRGAPPNFSMDGLPANPNPKRITRQLWWLRCMRLRLEPLSADGGLVALKPGYHSWGSRLPDYGLGDSRTDHSIRRAPDRTGDWWKDFVAAHDWTFTRAHSGNYTEINKYTNRLRNAMRSLTDLRPDDVYAYTIGQIDNDRTVEGWNEYRDEDETGDETHLWHRHDSFRRNIVGSFPHMWRALTIDMGWTYDEWKRSVAPPVPTPTPEVKMELGDKVWGTPTPAWAAPYAAMMVDQNGDVANPTVLNVMLHTLRHAYEAHQAAADNQTTLAAIEARLTALASDPASMTAPETHELVRVLRYVAANPTMEPPIAQ